MFIKYLDSLSSQRDQLRSIGVVLDLTTAGDLQVNNIINNILYLYCIYEQRSIAGYQGKTPNTSVMEKQVIINMCCKVMEVSRK